MNFQKHIKHLPLHEPDDWLWEKIDSQLSEGDAEQAKLWAALANLPQHEPPIKVWQKVEGDLQLIESEDIKLKLALSKLPQYEPPMSVWEITNQTLESNATEESVLKNALARLPQHEPPAIVWMKIMQELPAQKSAIVRVLSSVKMSAAAAVLGLVMIAGLYYFAFAPKPDSTSVAYSEEVVSDEVLKANAATNEEDEKAFAMLDDICAQQSFVCEQPEVKNLKSTLDELNTAHAQLKDAIGAYGTDENLLQQLQAIDLERTEVLKKIMNYI